MIYGPNVLLAFVGAAGVLDLALALLALPRYTLTPGRKEEPGWRVRLQRKLDQSDLGVTASEFITVALVAGLGLGVVLFFLTGVATAFPLGVVIGALGYWNFLEDRRDTRRREYQEALAEVVDILREGFGSGNSPQVALGVTAQYAPAVCRPDFEWVVTAMSLGKSPVDALRAVAELRRDVMLDRIVEALIVNLEKGGAIQPILVILAQSVRGLAAARRRIYTAQSTTRMEARLVCVAPIVFVVMMRQTAPDLMEPFLASEWGNAAVFAIGVMSALAYYWMNKIGASALVTLESAGIST